MSSACLATVHRRPVTWFSKMSCFFDVTRQHESGAQEPAHQGAALLHLELRPNGSHGEPARGRLVLADVFEVREEVVETICQILLGRAASPPESVDAWDRRTMRRPHPLFEPQDAAKFSSASHR